MAAVNDSQKKETLHDLDVKNINGQNVYVDHNGNVVRTEKRKDKVKLFASAKNKLNAMSGDNKKLSIEQMMAMQKQND